MFLSFQCLSQRRENYRIRIGVRKTEVRGTRNRERMGGREPPCSSPHGNQHSQVLSKKIDIALLLIMSRKWLQHHLSCLQDVDEFIWDIKKKKSATRIKLVLYRDRLRSLGPVQNTDWEFRGKAPRLKMNLGV